RGGLPSPRPLSPLHPMHSRSACTSMPPSLPRRPSTTSPSEGLPHAADLRGQSLSNSADFWPYGGRRISRRPCLGRPRRERLHPTYQPRLENGGPRRMHCHSPASGAERLLSIAMVFPYPETLCACSRGLSQRSYGPFWLP